MPLIPIGKESILLSYKLEAPMVLITKSSTIEELKPANSIESFISLK